MKLTVALDIHERPQLIFGILNEILDPLEFSPICASYCLILIVQVAVHISLELVEFLKFEIMLTLMILDLLHQVGLNLELLRLHLRLKDHHVFILASHLLLDVTAESSHLRLYLLDDCASINNLRKSVPHLPLGYDLVIPDLVVTSYHILSAPDYLIFENIKTLLKQVKFARHSRFFFCKLRILIYFLLDSMLNLALDLV